MTRSHFALVLTLLVTAGCTHVPAEPTATEPPRERLEAAREALHGGAFTTADRLLSTLAAGASDTAEGHEAQFLLGLLHLDPRNPAWNPAEAEILLAQYLELPFGARRPEAVALYALARRLATPRPTRAVPFGSMGSGTAAAPPPSATDASEVERLRRELAARDRELVKLREELERIRRTLTPSG